MDLHLFCVSFSGDTPHSTPWQQLENRLRNFSYRPVAIDGYSWFVISPRAPDEVISELEGLLDTVRARVSAVEVTRANLDDFAREAALIEKFTAGKSFPNL
jgi:hypothetical protein